MSSYYDSIGSAFRSLNVIEKLAALILVRDEWRVRIETDLFVPLSGNPVEGAKVITSSWRTLSDRIDEMVGQDEHPTNWILDETLQAFHSLAHELGSMRIEFDDDDGDKRIASDNPSPPQGKWIKYLSQLAELRAMFKS